MLGYVNHCEYLRETLSVLLTSQRSDIASHADVEDDGILISRGHEGDGLRRAHDTVGKVVLKTDETREFQYLGRSNWTICSLLS